MSRIIRTNEDLSGRTLDVSTLPDGHARESYIGGGSLQNATIIGDIRGSDILAVPCEGLDLSQADTYGCLWTQSTFDETSVLPPDPGPFQREILFELLRRHMVNHVPQQYWRWVTDIVDAVKDGRFADLRSLSDQVMSDPDRAEQARLLWQALPTKIRRWIRTILMTAQCVDPPTSTIAHWPDGVQVTLDRKALPPLPRPDDRYELKQWIVQQAGPAPVDAGWERHAWVVSIRPWPRVLILPTEDAWLEPRYQRLEL